jgi:hypothetical protein
LGVVLEYWVVVVLLWAEGDLRIREPLDPAVGTWQTKRERGGLTRLHRWQEVSSIFEKTCYYDWKVLIHGHLNLETPVIHMKKERWGYDNFGEQPLQ